MTPATTRPSGFFRFPGRVTPRITLGAAYVCRVKHPDDPSARESFRPRPVEIATPPVSGDAPPAVAPTARITVRV